MNDSEYCPHYSSLSNEQRVEALANMAVGIARYESGYDPSQHFAEPGLGYDSIGLYQLSYEDAFPWCSMDQPSKSLEDPITNIRCAVPEMARLAAKDKIISGPTAGDNRGLGRYWSVVRAGSQHKRAQIIEATRAYAACG